MVVNRTSTQYRKLPSKTDLNENADAIELLENPAQGVQHDDTPTNSTKPNREGWNYGKEPSYRLLASPGEETKADDYDLPSRNVSTQYELPPRPTKRRFLSGWRVGVLFSLIGATLVCIFNSAVTIWVWKGGRSEINGDIGTLFEGNCMVARKMNVWIHLIVNILSTLLLGASNYCMQVLSAPNREELVNAHARRLWLHIGVPSLRNIRHIGGDRAIIWIALLLSSMPLHLLFNAVVFTNLQTNNYVVVPTTEEWFQGGPYDDSSFLDFNPKFQKDTVARINKYRPDPTERVDLGGGEMSQKYKKFSAEECFLQYGQHYVSGIGNVYLIQESPTIWRDLGRVHPVFNLSGEFTWHNKESYASTKPEYRGDSKMYTPTSLDIDLPFFATSDQYPSNGWRCPSHLYSGCDVDNGYEVPSDRSKWQPYERPINYCMVEQVRESCKVQFSFYIAITVIASNFVKAVCMALLLFWYRKHTPLVTLGDAIAHFLEHPDPETRGRCLHDRRLIAAEWNWEKANSARKGGLGIEPEPFDKRRVRWGSAPSGGRWIATYLLFFIAIIAGIVCMARSLQGMPRNVVKLWEVGFGTIRGNNLLNLNTSVFQAILRANIPQAALSYLYVAFNALYTNMFVAREWATYSANRKPLRVSAPIGQQRNTYWLNVPFRWAIPITVASGLFHWLASQSIFMVQIDVTNENTRKIQERISDCGFSPMAIILTFLLGSLLGIAGIVAARLRYPPGVPLASSCSAAISAACHPPPGDENASLRPVQWGAIPGSDRVRRDGTVVGHCSFSGLPVEVPVPGKLYA